MMMIIINKILFSVIIFFLFLLKRNPSEFKDNKSNKKSLNHSEI